MESEATVFSSNIIRSNNISRNNLYDILNIIPVQPLPKKNINSITDHNCEFIPKCDKFYIPKKKNGRKVKTVRDIRNTFERDMFTNLPVEIEKQRNTLLRKIRFGSSKDEKTIEYARNILKNNNPISKSAWQILMNINPDGHKFSSQYILFRGKCIQINGSKGGQYKFICKNDVGKIKTCSYKKSDTKSTVLSRKRRLLHHSLSVKFKPGPLTMKKYLDISYQKYQFGELEVVNLPKPGLEVQTSYGKPLAPALNTFLHKSFFHNDNGLISQKWANFAVSVLGTNKNGILSQICEDSGVTFDLSYNCLQHKILMRHDSDIINKGIYNATPNNAPLEEESTIYSEVRSVIDNILSSVEISIQQNKMYTGEDEPRVKTIDNTFNVNSQLHNKNKRKFGELDRLDVTVIRISEPSQIVEKSIICKNDYCNLGCICDSLKCSYNLKRHCGQIECMFKCKCDFSKYKYMNSFDNDSCTDIIPGLINLDERLGQTLAKEEHKFHQTVIVTDEKSILLKSDKRNWKTPKKYAEFYSNMRLKTENQTSQIVSVVCQNLDCKNIEPWCMVHNLYKCFCKGKFAETGYTSFDELKTPENENVMQTSNNTTTVKKYDQLNEDIDKNQEINTIKSSLRSRFRQDSRRICKYNVKKHLSNSSESSDFTDNNDDSFCARILPYSGRKYNDKYYYDMHKKMMEMEKDDEKMRDKMISLINNEEDRDNNIQVQDNVDLNPHPYLKEMLRDLVKKSHNERENTKCTLKPFPGCDGRFRRLPNKAKFVEWLEKSYILYKKRISQGFVKICLEAPQAGRLCLYPWDFILSRYQEKKNHFLISKQKPYRIFMVIHIHMSYYNNCVNINDLDLSSVDEYPVTVKNLLTNANLKENFCILGGLSQCWEVIGSVTKVNEKQQEPQKENQSDQVLIPAGETSQFDNTDCSYKLDELPIIIDGAIQTKCNNPCTLGTEHSCVNNGLSNIPVSKWFIMKVENDFSEIQFYEKGFFVKYDSVVKAIYVAKVSGKTVRLSNDKTKQTTGSEDDAQFGIYAIPSDENLCVFIGPYEKEENLGIEAIKNMQTTNSNAVPQLRTRGIWITTKKADNVNVIDNPLQFIPPDCLQDSQMMTLDMAVDSNVSDKVCNDESIKVSHPKNVKQCINKKIKPIKIPKSNGFYHLLPNGCLEPIKSPEKNISLLANSNLVKSPVKINSPVSTKQPVHYKQISKNEHKPVVTIKPVAEIAPHVKKVDTNININKIQGRKLEGNMFVLKPEEINKRSFQKLDIQPQTSQQHQTVTLSMEDEMSMDIEKFLQSSEVCSPPRDEIYIISDDENEKNLIDTFIETTKNVWIISKTVEKLGWIAGKLNSDNCISFEFPGFKCSKFYPKCEALKKISEIFARKVYVPKHIDLDWHIVESEDEIRTFEKLELKYLCADYILTKKGLRHKHEVMKKLESLSKEDSPECTKETKAEKYSFNKISQIMSDFEKTSKALEDESSYLLNETMSNKNLIQESILKASEELRKELTDKLNSIVTISEE